MVDIKTSRMWVQQHKILFYLISFLSFWVALLLQFRLAQFLAKYVSKDLLGIATIAGMWLLAMFVLPIIGSVIAVYILIKYNK